MRFLAFDFGVYPRKAHVNAGHSTNIQIKYKATRLCCKRFGDCALTLMSVWLHPRQYCQTVRAYTGIHATFGTLVSDFAEVPRVELTDLKLAHDAFWDHEGVDHPVTHHSWSRGSSHTPRQYHDTPPSELPQYDTSVPEYGMSATLVRISTSMRHIRTAIRHGVPRMT
eukprot:2256000-Rhodomonas_salina.1